MRGCGSGRCAPRWADPLVERGDGGRRQRHHAFGGELAQRHLQPGAGGPVVDDAAEFQVEQLADPQPGAAQHVQPDPGERIIQASNGVHHRRVDVGGQRARQRLVKLGDVGGEDQPPRRRLFPAPGGDVIEQVAQAQHRRLRDRGRDGATGAGGSALPAPAPGTVPGQVALDAGAVQPAQAGNLGVVGGEVFGERQQVVDQRFHRLRAQHRRAHPDVAQQGVPDRFGHRDLGETLLEAACRVAAVKVRCRPRGSHRAAGAGWPTGPGRRAATIAGSQPRDSAVSNSSITSVVRSATSPPCQASTTARHSPSTVSTQELRPAQPVSRLPQRREPGSDHAPRPRRRARSTA